MAGKSRVLYRGQASGGVSEKFHLYISGSLRMAGMSRVSGCSFLTTLKEPAPGGIMENKLHPWDLKKILTG